MQCNLLCNYRSTDVLRTTEAGNTENNQKQMLGIEVKLEFVTFTSLAVSANDGVICVGLQLPS